MTPPDLQAAFDPEGFRREGHRAIDILADYLARAERGADLPVVAWQDPERLAASWPAEFPAEPSARLPAILERALAEAMHLHHPRYLGHQVAAVLPAAALLDLAVALLNNGMAIYEMGPTASVMERIVCRWLASLLGWGEGAGGVLTSGGSAGNLTALLAARQAKAGFNAWEEGAGGGPPLCVLASDQAHYSVARAVHILGLGRGGLVAAETDGSFRLRAAALRSALAAAGRSGRKVIAVVASACTTATGAFDPLAEIADFCGEHGLWLHVDGAHGASAALSAKYRGLLAGIERADSVVWDAHKMLLIPALATAVLCRDGSRSYAAFAQEASYLYADPRPRDEWQNVSLRTLECTKRMIALKVYGALAVHGTRVFADHVTSSFDLARRFAERLRAAADFELGAEPEANIVCFRHRPPGATGTAAGADLDAVQRRARRRLLESGRFYLSETRLPAGLFLRAVIMNPLTGEDDLAALLDAVREAAGPGAG
jgi:L-2,4-diaminobutyrate decarboxylase